MKEYIKQFSYLLDSQIKKNIPYLILGFLLGSILDVAGIGLIGIFLGLLTNLKFFLNKFSQISFLSNLSEIKLVFYFGGIIISAFILKAILTLYMQNKVVYISKFYCIRLKERLLTEYQHAPYLFLLQNNTTVLLSRIQNNVNNFIDNVFLPLFNITSNAIITLFIMILLFVIYPFMTGFLVILFVSTGLIYDLISKKNLFRIKKIFTTIEGEILKIIHQALHGLIEIRVLGKEKFFSNQLKEHAKDDAKANAVLSTLRQLPRHLIENLIAVFIIGVSLFCITQGLEKSYIITMLGIYAGAGGRLLTTTNQIMFNINQVRAFLPTSSLMYQQLKELNSASSSDFKKPRLKNEKLIFSSFQLDNLCFTYPAMNYSVLKDIRMDIHKGQSIGIIGPSGSGKTTLVNAILGLIKPDKGQLLVDNKPIYNYQAWLSNFAYIPQSIFLLDDTVRRNIAIGIKDNEIDELKVIKAMQAAQLSEVVDNLPLGLETMIGENGVHLSGGQRQRIALARAFYYDRDIIIMDEATSALDNETEKEVINSIKRIKGNKTLIVIAHRLNTVEHCDMLYRLDHGQIKSSGTYQEVVKIPHTFSQPI